jgi:mannose-1-phosphate guanylyltransferase
VKALVLAGGYGTRLRPLTHTRPKHMLPIANRPHIEHVFDLLLRYGVTEAVLLASYLSEAFDEVLESAGRRGLSVAATLEKEPLGTAGAVKNAQDLVGDGAFLVFNGDILTNTDLLEVTALHRRREAEATIVLAPVDDPSAFGVVPTNDDGRVQGFIEKPPPDEAPTNLINAGIYIFEPSVLGRIPAGTVWSAEHQLFPQLVDDGGRFFAVRTDSYWMDIGTPAKYLRANLDALDGTYRTEGAAPLQPGAVLAAPDATVETGAWVRSSCLGEGVRVAAPAVVSESVLLPGVEIAGGARVMNCVLGEGARVKPEARLQGRTIADGETAQ